jgi:mono/diheme cytochrome c family protein
MLALDDWSGRGRGVKMKRLFLSAGMLLTSLLFVHLTYLPTIANAVEAHPGRAVVLRNCFQCHTDAMFRDQRQDRNAWEATIYRMVGRGGLWTPEEIKSMADYLGADFGPPAASR